MRNVAKPIMIGVACTAVAISGASAYVWYENQRPAVLEVYVIPLKTGQAVFIRTPNDKRVLIDGGPNSEIIRQLGHILPFYSRRIDTIIITKADSNHASGLIDVINRYEVGNVVLPAITLQSLGLATTTDQVYQTFLDTINAKKLKVKEVVEGDSWQLDSAHQKTADISTSSVNMAVVFPAPVNSLTSTFKYSKASAPELLMNVSYGGYSMYLLGTATTKIQKYIASSSATSTLSVLVTAKNPISTNITASSLAKFNPTNIIYSKAIKKNDPVGPSDVSGRFNIREVGVVKITSDGVNPISISYSHP